MREVRDDKPTNFYMLVKVLYKGNRNPGLPEVRKWFENEFVNRVAKLADSVKLVEFSAPKHDPEGGKTLSKGAEVKIAVAGAKNGFHEEVVDTLLSGKRSVPWFGSYTIYLLNKVRWSRARVEEDEEGWAVDHEEGRRD